MARKETETKRDFRPEPLFSLHHSFSINKRINLYLLDRNIVSVIKGVNAGHLPDREDKVAIIEELRSLDRAPNFFSPMTSITEGNMRGAMTKAQFRAVIDDEAAALKNFFHRANTDSDFLVESSEVLCSLPNGLHEHLFDDYVAFLETVSPEIHQPIAARRRKEIRDKIIHEAVERKIVPTHPVAICCLSVLYGSDVSRGVLKPKCLSGRLASHLNRLRERA